MSTSMDPNATSSMPSGSGDSSPEDDGRIGGGVVEGSPTGRGSDYYDDRPGYGERPRSSRPQYDERPSYYEDRGRDRYRDDERSRYERNSGYGRSHNRYDGDDDGPGFAEGASRFSRQHIQTGETKEFFKTSEFFATVLGIAALVIAAAVQDTFDAHGMWRLVTALLFAYIVSRGIAKAGSDKREGRGRNGGR